MLAVLQRTMDRRRLIKKGYDITVRLDNGDNLLTIVQAAEVEIIKGQRVRVVSGSNGDRVLPFVKSVIKLDF